MSVFKKYNSTEVLNFIRKYKEENQHSPSYETIKQALNFSSKSMVRFHLDKLKDAGRIRFIYSHGERRPKVTGVIINE